MTVFRQSTFRLLAGLFLLFITEACAPTLRWVPDPLPHPTCLPDRLLEWTDFVPRHGKDSRAAETAVRFTMDQQVRLIRVEVDHEHSWVKPELADPQNSNHWRISEQLLAHEQVHYLISCLVVRQANLSLTADDNLLQMLELTRSVAQRLNLQYDRDTHHGTKRSQQDAWQEEVMKQFSELGSERENRKKPPALVHQ